MLQFFLLITFYFLNSFSSPLPDSWVERHKSLQDTICQLTSNKDEAVIEKILEHSMLFLKEFGKIQGKEEMFSRQIRISADSNRTRTEKREDILRIWREFNREATEKEQSSFLYKIYILIAMSNSVQPYWECNSLNGIDFISTVYSVLFTESFQSGSTIIRKNLIQIALNTAKNKA